MSDRYDLSGRVALVCGAGSVGPGFSNGKAISVLLARHGATIVAVDRDLSRAEETCHAIEAEGGAARPVAADVTELAALEDAREALARDGMRPTLLVNNAGGSVQGDAVTLSEEDWHRQLDLNLTSAFFATKVFLPVMRDDGAGAIVNIGSVAGVRGAGDTIAYSTAKAGLIQFGRQVALRHAKDGIRCNTVIPGVMHTPMVEARLLKQRDGGDAQAFIDARNRSVPMGKMGDAWEVAHATHFMLSDAAGYITGTALLVDGGAALVTFR